MMTLVLAALGAKAAPADWSYTVEVDGESVTYTGKYDIAHDKVRIEVNEPGGLAVFINQSKNEDPALKGICADNAPIILEIESKNCSLIADDFSALNTSTTPALSHFESLSFGKVTVESISTMSGLSMSGVKFLRLPDGFTSAADLSSMSGFKTANPLLQAVGSYKKGENNNRKNELTIHSFQENSMLGLKNVMKPEFGEAKIVTLSGIYGDMDLNSSTNGGSSLVFNGLPAKWDLSKATFTTCTPRWGVEFANNSHYYAIDDPFELHPENAKTSLTPEDMANTNAFFYFNGYGKAVVEITFPENITELPPYCLEQLCNDNKENYKILKGMSEENFKATFGNNATCVPLENLVIPASVATVGYECAYNTHIKKITFGNGLKEVQGGAFKQVQGLEDIVFETGISNCKLGHDAFQLCYDVKHIVLTEGIVSLGAGCFQNSQQMESIRLPETLLYIGNRCFDNNLALGSITIPSNVERIGKKAFNLTALRDVFLTTTDPAKIPVIYTAGTSWEDEDATFGRNQLWGNNGIPWSAEPNHWTGYTVTNEGNKVSLTWDEAVVWYYIHASCMTVLHYPPELAEKVMARISSTYNITSADGFGLPGKNPVGVNDELQSDAKKRANGLGEVDLGTDGTSGGIWTNDGWVQFLLMKESVAHEGDRYTKNYKDVWYTMCFPFELTDEQLASAFNEGFNIVDFSGIQIKDPNNPNDNVEKKTLVLHFNKVAETLYKDTNGNLYERKMVNGNVVREEDGDDVKFEYNVYIRNGQEYHHVTVATGEAARTKTKTFAPGSSLDDAKQHKDQAILIDGYLASAGHPYMIHPNTGTVPEADPVPCHFSGITWVKGDDEGAANNIEGAKTTDEVRDELYEAQKRTIDMGTAKTTNNFAQAAYPGYEGQEYTFIGNPRIIRADAEVDPEPTFTLTEPVYPDIPTELPTEPEEEEITTAPTAPTNPATNEKYTDSFKELYNSVRVTYTDYQAPGQPSYDVTYGEDLVNCDQNEFLEYHDWQSSYWCRTQTGVSGRNNAQLNSDGLTVFKNYFGGEPIDLTGFNALKLLASNYANDLASYESNYANYLDEYNAYIANHNAWEKYRSDLYNFNHSAELISAYETAKGEYDDAYDDYLDDHEAWENSLAAYKVKIPQYAYFLGTKAGETYPKYFREKSANQSRPGGNWTQYSAIIKPNSAAIAGLEAELDGTTQSSSGSKIAFNEPFFFIDDTPQGITTLIEKIEKEEGKADVQYMDIVVSIDGKIISRDKTSIEGLPKGVYIINGKKYYVK